MIDNAVDAYTKVEHKDPARGLEASLRVAQGEKLDKRYRPASRRVLTIIVGIPFIIVLGWELYQRRFMGKEKRSVILAVSEADGDNQRVNDAT